MSEGDVEGYSDWGEGQLRSEGWFLQRGKSKGVTPNYTCISHIHVFSSTPTPSSDINARSRVVVSKEIS